MTSINNRQITMISILLIIFCILDKFDCLEDPCHLAWLIRDRRHLLDQLKEVNFEAKENNGSTTYEEIRLYPTCSNGTTFDQLDPRALVSCPTL